MDLEQRVKRLEGDIEHDREMRKLHSARMDAQDVLIRSYELRHAQAIEDHDEAIQSLDRAIADGREETKELRGIVMEIGTMLQKFIASMTGKTKNGSPQADV